MFSGDSQIRAKDERAPKGFRDRRAATTDEIDAEQERRAIYAAANAARAAFAARQDVKDVHSNFCRIHQTLRVTPAMEAGISNHVWSIEELVALLEK
jgi:hypothetical protein